jgi:hypothetical protein
MPRPKSENEVETLETELAQLNKKLEDAKARARARKAAEDSRRWHLAGLAAVQQMQDAPDSEFFKTMMSLLEGYARSASDRALFGLAAKPSNGADAEAPSPTLLP